MRRDDLAARLLQTFLAELDDQLGALESELLVMERGAADDPERLGRVFRVAHTLKGAARVANVPVIEATCHALESRLADARTAGRALSEQELALLFAAVDALADAGRRLRVGEPADAGPLGALERRLSGGGLSAATPSSTPTSDDGTAHGGSSPTASSAPTPSASTPATNVEPAQSTAGSPHGGTPGAPGTPATPPAPPSPSVRVETIKLDDLLHATGQLAVTVSCAAEQPVALESLAGEAERWMTRWRRRAPRLRQALARADTTAAEQQLVEQLEVQLRRMTTELGRLAVVARGDSRALHRASADVAEELQRLRLRPFAEAVEGLPRTVRDVAAASGRLVALELAGTEIEADRAVIDILREALLHLVRNAVDHGIEPSDERVRLGKPPEGTVRVVATLRGADLRVTVHDDGRGLDTEAVRRQLAARGMPVPESEGELAEVLFLGGFSTRRETTTISGRGVGLDAVRSAVHRARGSVRVRWTADVGTTFIIETPLSLASQRALVVAVGKQRLAIPAGSVARLLRVDPSGLGESGGQRLLATPTGPVPIVSLAAVLGSPLVERPPDGRRPVVVLEVGERRLAVAVDRLVEETELVVRPIERRGGGTLGWLAGAAILADGEIALVLNPAAVVATGLGRQSAGLAGAAAGERAGPAPRQRIMVVDDSITTRTLEQSVLEAAGYDVITAVDGDDGWRLLQERGADLVLTDVEMPRMDGIALCEAIRGSKRFAQLPVIIVTSLEAPEQRQRGLEAGADAYVVKSGFDQTALLATVHGLLVRDRS
ncbi:MAG: hybrid sensor histidine kinase/response regulator [Gemmatimonadaceae bacterium]